MAQLNDLIVTGDARINGDLMHNSGMVAFGTCSTAAGTAAKEVVIDDPAWSLKVGDIIGVKCTASNTASSCTINVNGSGAKQIWYNTSVYTGTSTQITGAANRLVYYIYDGTYWSWLSGGYDANDNAMPAAISWTAAGTAAKTASQNYYTAIKGYTLVTFQYANTAASALTLNINGKGAKPIYLNGAASSASNYTLPAGCYLTYFDGTNYYIRTDGLITGSITGNAATATKLATARNINGVSFNGTANITVTANPTPNQLTNQDLNNTTTPGYYYGGGSNTVLNKPTGADAFGLVVYKTAGGYVTQEFTNGNNNPLTKYIRQYNGSTWSAWQSATASDDAIVSSNDTVENIVTLTSAEYEALTTKEKNTLYNIIDDTESTISTIADLLYPIGRGFLDFTNTDYSNWLGFTWERELVGMFPVGYKSGDTDFGTIGKIGGEKTHTLTVAEMPSHTHTQNAHTHSVTLKSGSGPTGSGWTWLTNNGNTATYTSGSTTAVNQNTGGGGAHNNLPPYQVVSYWKRVS